MNLANDYRTKDIESLFDIGKIDMNDIIYAFSRKKDILIRKSNKRKNKIKEGLKIVY